MMPSVLLFLGAAGVIVIAGVGLTQFAALISHRTKLGSMFVGGVLLAGATSLPELATDVSAVQLGELDLAVGDLFGSCLFNLLIISVLDLTRFSRGRMLSEISAAQAMAASVSIALIALAGAFIFMGGRLEAVALFGIGPGCALLILGYLIGMKVILTAQKVSTRASAKGSHPVEVWRRLRSIGLKGATTGYAFCALMIVVAAPFLARASADLAEQTGLGGTFFGSTAVALSTSLPEIVTTITAVRMTAFELAVGNVFGSNCFNLGLLGLLDFFAEGSLLASVSAVHLFSAFAGIAATAVLVVGQLYRVERKKPFLEPDALASTVLILAGLAGLYFARE
jgi:cation:H+ antiporter